MGLSFDQDFFKKLKFNFNFIFLACIASFWPGNFPGFPGKNPGNFQFPDQEFQRCHIFYATCIISGFGLVRAETSQVLARACKFLYRVGIVLAKT